MNGLSTGLALELDAAGGATVVIWCRAFSVSFGAAQLAPA
jgi:Electron transfer DM13